MARRSIGQERFGFGGRERAASSLDALVSLIDWRPVAGLLDPLYPATRGEPAWPPLAMFRALLLSIWYDLSDVKLAEALDDRASFRRFCGFFANEATLHHLEREHLTQAAPAINAILGRGPVATPMPAPVVMPEPAAPPVPEPLAVRPGAPDLPFDLRQRFGLR